MPNLSEWGYHAYQRLPKSLQDSVFEFYGEVIEPLTIGRKFHSEFFDYKDEYKQFKQEYYNRKIDGELREARNKHAELAGHGKFAGLNKFTPQRLYAYVRKYQPDVIVETGVCNGVSTLVVLRALERNGTGHLYSIDLPDEQRLPEEKQPGWIVPEQLQDQWTLIIGDSLEQLPDVLMGLDGVDLFMHDTTTRILDDELSIMWPHLAPEAVIFADDIHSNRMFDEINATYIVKSGHVAPNVAYFQKLD